MHKGFIHIYTGDGKGKTTSAVGLSVRAKSRGLRVLFVQFMKTIKGGEIDLLKNLSIKVKRFEKVLSPLFHPGADMALLREESLKALGKLRPLLREYDLVVLDEFNHLLTTGLVTRKEALDFIMQRPETLDLVLTGRGAPKWLVDLADQVTDMRDVKHPAAKGARARKGIEY